MHQQDLTKDELIVNKYPLTFKRYKNGLSICDGWLDLIDETAAKLEIEIQKFIKNIKIDEKELNYCKETNSTREQYIETITPTTSDLKEKFGGLRWYLSSGTDKMYDIVDKAEIKSFKMCYVCGKSGKMRGKYWYYIACLEHTKDSDILNIEIYSK